MEKEIIIETEVKNGLAGIGISDDDRKEYVSFVQEKMSDFSEEGTEEEFTTKVKDLVSILRPTAKNTQRTRTYYQQQTSELTKQIEDLKSKIESAPKDEPKDKPKDNPTDNALLEVVNSLKTQLADMQKAQNEERAQRIADENKKSIIREIKADYNKEAHDLIDIFASSIDFSKEDAKIMLKSKISDYAKLHPTQIVKGGSEKNEKGVLDDYFKRSEERMKSEDERFAETKKKFK